MAPVTTGQIYWGAVPYVVIQVIMVALVIVFPQMVMVYKDDAPKVDPTKIQIDIPTMDAEPPADRAGSWPGAAQAGPPRRLPSPATRCRIMLNQQQQQDKGNDDLQNPLKAK